MPLTLEHVVPAHVERRTMMSDGKVITLDPCVDAIAFVDEDHVFCGSDDHSCSLWNVPSATRRFSFHTKQQHGARCVAVDTDGKHAVSGHGSWGGVCLWNLETGALVHQLDESLMYVSAVGFFQPRIGDREVIAHVGGGLFRWSMQTGAVVKADDHGGKKHATAFSSTHVLRTLPKSTTLSSLPAEKKLADFEAVPRAQCAAFSADGAWAGAGGDNGVVRVFDVAAKAVVFAKDASDVFRDTVKCIAVGNAEDGAGARVAYGTQGGAVVVVRVGGSDGGRDDGRDDGNDDGSDVTAVDTRGIRSLAFSPSGRRLAVGRYDGNVHVFRV